jgi:hypothetical protein
VFLEVWRDALAVPETQTYGRNPDPTAATYTLTQAIDQVEQLAYTAGTAGNNFAFNQVGEYNHAGYAVRWQISTAANVPSSALYDPCALVVAGTAVNHNGVAFTGPATGDSRLWSSVSVTSLDGMSWALPLFVVRRTNAENGGGGIGITEYRSNSRYVFPVYSGADTAKVAHELIATAEANDLLPVNQQPAAQEPSGFLSGLDFVLTGGALADTLQIYNNAMRVRVRGFDDWVRLSSHDIALGSPPAASYARTLVYLKASITVYRHQDTATRHISHRYRPWLPATFPGGTVGVRTGQGWRRGYLTWEVVVAPLGAVDVRDEDDSMVLVTAGSWVRGDQYIAGTPYEFSDGGLWSRAVAIDVDDRIHPYATEWAIPICLVHRRNTGVWTLVNPNGTAAGGADGDRPDTRTVATVVHPDDLVDLRHQVDVSEAEVKARLEADADRLMTGSLRTRMANRWATGAVVTQPTVAGTRILQSDIIGPATPGCFNLKQPDGERMIWSDAREFDVVARGFVNNAVETGLVTWNHAVTGDTITVGAPAGASIVRQLPAFYLASVVAGADYLHYDGPPCWSTRHQVSSGNPLVVPTYPVESEGKYTQVTTALEGSLVTPVPDGTFTASAWDAYGRATRMTGTSGTFGGDIGNRAAALSWWVHYDRDPSGVDEYNGNYGLAEIPDVVHRAVYNNGADQPVGIGTLYALVRKDITGVLTTTVTLANVDAVKPANVTGNTDKLIGIAVQALAYGGGGVVPALASVTMDVAQTSITLTWAGPGNGFVDIVVFYETDQVTKWIEVGRGGKSVRALFGWVSVSPAVGGGGGVAAYARQLGSSVWQHAEVADQMVEMPLVWKMNGPVWDLQNVISPQYYADYPLSNLFSLVFEDLQGVGVAEDFLICAPARTPLASGTTLLLHYTYTPYQGLSSSGGAVATAATAVPALQQMLHGTIVDSTDFYAVQAGPCSVYGGVETWCGAPARQLSVTVASNAVNPHLLTQGMGSRFSLYNATCLVDGRGATGTAQLGLETAAAQDLAAAALLRLPFPTNPAMVTGAPQYHAGTEEYDLDPGREGASAGFFSYAVGYPSGLTVSKTATQDPHLYAVYEQFLNGLVPLATTGLLPATEDTYVASPSEFVMSSSSSLVGGVDAYTLLNTAENFITSAQADLWALLLALRPRRGSIVGATYTFLEILGSLADIIDGSTTGLYVADGLVRVASPVALDAYLQPAVLPVWSYPGGAGTSALVCTAPGAIMAHIANGLVDTAWTLQIRVQEPAGGKVQMHNTLVVSSGAAANVVLGGARDIVSGTPKYMVAPVYQPQADVVRFPMASYGSVGTRASGSTPQGSGHGSLKGLTVAYPVSWAGITAEIEALWAAATGFHPAYGRGLYCGTTTTRYCAPVLVPGSGTTLRTLLQDRAVVLSSTSAQAPKRFPVQPGQPLFATSNRRWLKYDHGGQAAYVGFGAVINPASDQYQGRCIMQWSGGPVGAQDVAGTNLGSPEGTALDAFHMTGRPILTQQRK